MAKLAIIYGTSEGQTRNVAEHIAGVARGHGHTVEIVDVTRAATACACGQRARYDTTAVRNARQHLASNTGEVFR